MNWLDNTDKIIKMGNKRVLFAFFVFSLFFFVILLAPKIASAKEDPCGMSNAQADAWCEANVSGSTCTNYPKTCITEGGKEYACSFSCHFKLVGFPATFRCRYDSGTEEKEECEFGCQDGKCLTEPSGGGCPGPAPPGACLAGESPVWVSGPCGAPCPAGQRGYVLNCVPGGAMGVEFTCCSDPECKAGPSPTIDQDAIRDVLKKYGIADNVIADIISDIISRGSIDQDAIRNILKSAGITDDVINNIIGDILGGGGIDQDAIRDVLKKYGIADNVIADIISDIISRGSIDQDAIRNILKSAGITDDVINNIIGDILGGGGDGGRGGSVSITNPLGYKGLGEFINHLINFLFTLSLAVLPIMIVIAGFLFVTAAGDPKQIDRGKRLILWSLIGFVIILISKGLIEMLKYILGG